MELKTQLYDTGGGGRDVYYHRESEIEHDAAAAHALVMAIKDWWGQPDSGQIADGAVTWIEDRAAELMREWGFTDQAGGE